MPPRQKKSPAPSDAELIDRHLSGDSSAFEMLVRRYWRELYGFLVRFAGDANMAEDILQETFYQLHASAGAFDTTRRLKPWLFTIAANKARDMLRKRSRRSAAPLDAAVGPQGDQQTSYADIMPADVPAPHEVLSNIETRQAVKTIVGEMPEHLKTVLLLCYFHDFSYKEIAKMREIPIGTVKSRLHAAVKNFADRWTYYTKGRRSGNE